MRYVKMVDSNHFHRGTHKYYEKLSKIIVTIPKCVLPFIKVKITQMLVRRTASLFTLVVVFRQHRVEFKTHIHSRTHSPVYNPAHQETQIGPLFLRITRTHPNGVPFCLLVPFRRFEPASDGVFVFVCCLLFMYLCLLARCD